MKESIIERFVPLFLASLLTVGIVLSQLNKFPEFKNVPDAEHHIAMAEGKYEVVPQHHSRRVLYSWIVSKLQNALGTDMAFFTVGTLSLFLFLWVVLVMIRHVTAWAFSICAAFIFLPYLLTLHYELYLPTIFFLLLSSLFCMLLIKKRYLLSLFVLFLLFLTRGEAIIIAFGFILSMVVHIFKNPRKKSYYSYILLTILLGSLSSVILTFLTKDNTNINQIPFLPFLFLRVPLYFLRNFVGLEHWLDTYRSMPYYPHQPLIAFEAPQWIQDISAIKQFGIYKWSLENPMKTFLLLLSSFGTAPTILLFFLKKKMPKLSDNTPAFSTILFFGGIIFILAPILGQPFLRYYVTAWPVFFLIAPFFLKHIKRVDKKLFVKILFCYILSAWLAVAPFKVAGFLFVMILIELGLHKYTWNLLSSWFKKPEVANSLVIDSF